MIRVNLCHVNINCFLFFSIQFEYNLNQTYFKKAKVLKFWLPVKTIVNFSTTRPKPVEHGYVFSIAVGTIGEWLKLVPFLLGNEQLILKGGGVEKVDV